jgi:hypothetical protein
MKLKIVRDTLGLPDMAAIAAANKINTATEVDSCWPAVNPHCLLTQLSGRYPGRNIQKQACAAAARGHFFRRGAC